MHHHNQEINKTLVWRERAYSRARLEGIDRAAIFRRRSYEVYACPLPAQQGKSWSGETHIFERGVLEDSRLPPALRVSQSKLGSCRSVTAGYQTYATYYRYRRSSSNQYRQYYGIHHLSHGRSSPTSLGSSELNVQVRENGPHPTINMLPFLAACPMSRCAAVPLSRSHSLSVSPSLLLSYILL